MHSPTCNDVQVSKKSDVTRQYLLLELSRLLFYCYRIFLALTTAQAILKHYGMINSEMEMSCGNKLFCYE